MRLANVLAVTLAGSLSLLSACADTTSRTPSGSGPARVAPRGADPSHARRSHCPSVSHAGHAALDYVDFLQANGRQYLAIIPAHQKSKKVEIATLQFRVRCDFSQLNDQTHRATPRPLDGDAGYLLAGTAVYSIERWSPACRLAAKRDGRWLVYVAEGPLTPAFCSQPQGTTRS